MSYRMDTRSKREFEKEIKAHSLEELEIILRICTFFKQRDGKWPKLEATGCDFTGKILKDSEVTSDPDFTLDGVGLEVTKSSNECKRYFHQKSNKVKKLIEDGHSIVFVNGISEFEEPKFIIWNSDDLRDFSDLAEAIYGIKKMPYKNGIINKDAYRYDLELVEKWDTLPELPSKLPKKYKKFYEVLEQNLVG